MSRCSKTLNAVVVPQLCTSLLRGGSILSANSIVLDHSTRTAIDKTSKIDIFVKPPSKIKSTLTTPFRPKERALQVISATAKARTETLRELVDGLAGERKLLNERHVSTWQPDLVALVHNKIELSMEAQLEQLDKSLRNEYQDLFAEELSHVIELPGNAFHEFRLKDASKTIQARSYPSPRKYREVWERLVNGHLAAGRLVPSSSKHSSPAFLIAKRTRPSSPALSAIRGN